MWRAASNFPSVLLRTSILRPLTRLAVLLAALVPLASVRAQGVHAEPAE